MNTKEFEKYFTSWDEGDTGYFKIAPIKLRVTESSELLEKKAKDAAKKIEAEVTYAWDLGESQSEAWWLSWGGFSLEEEIPFQAATSTEEALEKIKDFDPKDNEYECDSLDEFKEILFSAYDEDLKAKDLLRGYRLWLTSLDKEALATLKKDLESWTTRAK